MTFEAQRPRPRIQHVTVAGTALAAAVLPLVVGVLLAKAAAADPMTSVNALITNGAHRPRLSPAEWRSCGRRALRRPVAWRRTGREASTAVTRAA
ncbi:hypothetical protein ABZO31_32650 [Streptomyces sp. HUAS MG47]|uniref:hypothetical protein n=1 Tax=Streptomyces solicamelliae TaxID=3231716 RepID=UPI003877FAFF